MLLLLLDFISLLILLLMMNQSSRFLLPEVEAVEVDAIANEVDAAAN